MALGTNEHTHTHTHTHTQGEREREREREREGGSIEPAELSNLFRPYLQLTAS